MQSLGSQDHSSARRESSRPGDEHWRKRTVLGLKWQTACHCIAQSLHLVASVILARLLLPEDFGCLAMVVSITGFVQIFADLGLGAALIQRKELGAEVVNPTFWISVAMGILLTSLVWCAAPFMAAFYHEPRVQAVVYAVGINFTISAFAVVPRAIAQRQLRFALLAAVEMTAIILSRVGAVILAVCGCGLWSLVFLAISQASVKASLIWLFCPIRVDFKQCACKHIGDVIRFGLNLLGFNVLYYWVRNLDNVIIGRVGGPGELGIYSRAYQLMLVPVVHLSHSLSGVMFPALSRIQDDPARMKRVFLRSISALALVTVPLMCGALVCADSLILTLYGRKWAAAIPILRILCLAGLLQPVTSVFGWLYTALGRTDIMLKWGGIAFTVTAAGFIGGIPWGTHGVAWGYAIACTVLLLPSWAIPGHLIGLRLGEILRALLPILMCATLMGAIVFLTKTLLPPTLPLAGRLGTEIAVGVGAYVLLVLGFRLDAYRSLRSIIVNRQRDTPLPHA